MLQPYWVVAGQTEIDIQAKGGLKQRRTKVKQTQNGKKVGKCVLWREKWWLWAPRLELLEEGRSRQACNLAVKVQPCQIK